MGAKSSRPPDLTDMSIEMRMASKNFAREANRSLGKETQERNKVADVSGDVAH